MADALPYMAFGGVLVIVALVAIALRRGEYARTANEELARKQARQIELNERQMELNSEFQKNQLAALERIAVALERR
jgi:hypothetical protein